MKTIIWDVDGVLSNTHKSILERVKELTGKKFKTWKRYDLSDIAPGVSYDKIFDHKFFHMNKPLIDRDRLEGIWSKSESYVASKVINGTWLAKFQWIKHHFPFIHDEKIIFCDKKAVLRGDILVDDCRVQCREWVGSAGHKMSFMPPYGYNELLRWERFIYRMPMNKILTRIEDML